MLKKWFVAMVDELRRIVLRSKIMIILDLILAWILQLLSIETSLFLLGRLTHTPENTSLKAHTRVHRSSIQKIFILCLLRGIFWGSSCCCLIHNLLQKVFLHAFLNRLIVTVPSRRYRSLSYNRDVLAERQCRVSCTTCNSWATRSYFE